MADSWEGLTGFLTGTAELHAADRGMREVLLGTGYGRDRVARVRARLFEPVRCLIARAQADGHVRSDLRPQDIPILQLMVGAVADYGAEVDPELWRRHLTLLLDVCAPAATPANCLGPRWTPNISTTRCAAGRPPSPRPPVT